MIFTFIPLNTNISANTNVKSHKVKHKKKIHKKKIRVKKLKIKKNKNLYVNKPLRYSVNNSYAAKEIAFKESSNNYHAQNGRYYGKYQLDYTYLKGDYSPSNQEKTFKKYCIQRYGSIENALAFRRVHNWY